ncbi:serine protease inhibitor swm-1 [Xenopus laevis]|uniref:TIL domain-containing protein n=2 Tax=Xenopus laevis TaxID=8355 RepID=A0A974CJT8_XENLA|nr:serine protease inhibitor swm-1 [Xenopus laevis]OCT73556.1 hypothetical protein XELAEV_18036535mg [Xenopus laevis]
MCFTKPCADSSAWDTQILFLLQEAPPLLQIEDKKRQTISASLLLKRQVKMLRNSPITLLLGLALTATLVISQNDIVPERLCPVNQRWYRCKPCLTLCGVKAKCLDKCVPGCACKPGYAKQTLDSQCIPEDKCIICKGLQVYTPCSGHCPPTCEPRMCHLMCIPGCKCKSGLVLHNGRCIPPSLCPKTLPANP